MRTTLACVAVALMLAGCSTAKPKPVIDEEPSLQDVGADVKPLLERLPGVAKVEVSPAEEKAEQRIIHVRHVHPIPKAAAVGNLKGEEAKQAWEDVLQGVRESQKHEETILIALAKDHGVTEVLAEGLTKENEKGYLDEVDILRRFGARVTEIEKRYVLAKVSGDKKNERELFVALRDFNARTAQIGPAGRLLILGKIKKVVPVEDAAKMKASEPEYEGDRPVFRKAAFDAREDAVVKNALGAGKVVVLSFGGGHNFADAVKRNSKKCEYVRVTPEGFEDTPPIKWKD